MLEQRPNIVWLNSDRFAADMDSGHTAPLLTLPIGCWARINTQRQRVEIVEASVT